MTTVRHTYRARHDLSEIWLHIAANDPTAADRVFDCIEARTEILTRFAEAGPPWPEIAPDARVLIESPYLILCRIAGDGVQIVRVLHGAQRIDEATFPTGIE